jgi:F-type H+-transporting ATPase subunit delta
MSMRGASRASLAALEDQLAAEDITSATVAVRLGNELFSVVGLLDAEHGLRRALGDPGKPAAEKGAVAGALLHGKVTQRTETLVAAAVESHWARLGDMVDAIEELEDELFRFSRVVSAQPDLRAALADPGLPEDRKHDVIGALLDGKVSKVTLGLVNQVIAHPRGRPLNEALDMCAGIAAQRKEQLIAVVRSAIELSAAQRGRLAAALSESYGRKMHLNIVLDPSVVGGISVQVGDELIDGTAASRLADVRRKLAG